MFKNLLLATVVVLSFFLIKTGNPVILVVTSVFLFLALFFENNIRSQTSSKSYGDRESETVFLPNLILARFFEICILIMGIVSLF